ncbi:hypothetical protein KKC91_07770 [bacterium]|nr:hypothetical protein [bacterium]
MKKIIIVSLFLGIVFLLCFSVYAENKNIVENPDFQLGLKYWSTWVSDKTKEFQRWEVDTDTFNRSVLKYVSTKKAGLSAVVSQHIQGLNFKKDTDITCILVHQASKEAVGRFAFALYQYIEGEEVKCGQEIFNIYVDTNIQVEPEEWMEWSKDFKILKGVDKIIIRINCDMKGTAYFRHVGIQLKKSFEEK